MICSCCRYRTMVSNGRVLSWASIHYRVHRRYFGMIMQHYDKKIERVAEWYWLMQRKGVQWQGWGKNYQWEHWFVSTMFESMIGESMQQDDDLVDRTTIIQLKCEESLAGRAERQWLRWWYGVCPNAVCQWTIIIGTNEMTTDVLYEVDMW